MPRSENGLIRMRALAIIKSWILPGTDPRQAVRMRRFLLAAACYGVSAALLVLAWAFGLIELEPVLVLIAAVAVIIVSLYIVFRTGFNLRFSDPSLTWGQTFIANIVLMYAIYSFNQGRAFTLMMFLVILTFGVFHFSTREFVAITLQILAGYAFVINLLMVLKPETVNVYQEWFQWAGLASILPLFAVVGGRISALRQRLRRSNEELRSALGAVRQVATHDALTGLPNRVLFNEELQHALARLDRHHRPVALFVLDLDRFKVLNDTLGHQFGDRVLQETAKRLLGCVRESDILARLGGDEFVILVEEFGEHSNLADVARKLLASVAGLNDIDGREVGLSVSIGICAAPEDGRDAKTLFANADIAMYRAKEMGRNNYCFFSAELHTYTLEKLALEAGLRHGLERGEFRVHYQPKIDIASGAISGVEALLRWQHPERGLVGPDKFIPLAEASGLIIPIGLWVLREACTRTKAWQDAGLPRFTVAVNLSQVQFRQEDLVLQVGEILKSTGLDPRCLELEITESVVMQDPDKVVAKLEAIRRMGVRIAIDDFGIGYSSLGYLKRLPINSLKVDRVFVRELPHSSDDIAITRAVIAMAHSLDMSVIAEGVELKEQFDALRKEGCDEYQGYLCRPPLTEDDLIRFIRDSGTRGARANSQ
ncbi:MAG TPA: EAL domain-containing protein [Burkholderiales bacterium]|nr:EAL domain-containing protein [Burkholderiales bacterium]